MVEDQDLCFGKLLPKEQVEAALQRHQVRFRERLYTPLLTIWTFLYQVLASDQSCRAAVARLWPSCASAAKDPGSAKTDPYCKARQRLPEKLLADLARRSGWSCSVRFPPAELLGGRPIKIADGTTVSMPDTPANQKAYPQQPGQKQGLGFPILRLVGLISLSCGAVLDVAMGPYRGKQTGETALLRQLLDSWRPGTSCWPMPSSPTTGPSPCCSNAAWICSVVTTASGGWISARAGGWAVTIMSCPGTNRRGRRG